MTVSFILLLNLLLVLTTPFVRTQNNDDSSEENNAHNKRYQQGLETYEVEIVSRREMKQRYFGANIDEHDVTLKKLSLPITTDLPSDWDIRVDGPGNLTEVKNQGACSSSWIFASVAAVENRLSIQDGSVTPLSEQQMVDCASKFSGCAGGWPIRAFNYIMEKGLGSSDIYPYKGTYAYCRERAVKNPSKISGFVQMENDPSMIKTMIMQNGACVMCVDASRWFNYRKGLFSNSYVTNQDKKCNHLVALVGWGTHGETGRPYWLLKNSWGNTWGEDGYIRVSADKYGGAFMHLVFCPVI